MESLDLRLKLLSGDSFYVDGVGKLIPPTLKDIVSIGYRRYSYLVGLLTIDVSKETGDAEVAKLFNGFDVIATSKDEEIKKDLVEAVKFFFSEEKNVRYSKEFNRVEIGRVKIPFEKDRAIDRENYDQIRAIVELVACIKPVGVGSNDYNPESEKARQIIEKLRASKEKIRKQKASSRSDDDSEDMDVSDMISAVSAMSNSLNIKSIWDITMYQLIDQYKRLEIISQYDFSMNAIFHTGKVDIKHWSSKIKEED